MKIAKVRDGLVQHVWPDTYTKKNGKTVTVNVPAHVLSYAKKGLPLPSCFVEVPDDVRRNFVWNEEEQAYTKREKLSHEQPKPHSDLLAVVADKIGVHHDDLWAEVMARKKARKQG